MAGPKTKENTQWGRIATDGGAIIPPGQVAGAYNDGKEPLVDAYGRPWVRVVDPSNPSGTPVNFRAMGFGGEAVISAVPVLDLLDLYFCAQGGNNNNFPIYVQLFNLIGPIGVTPPEYEFPALGFNAPISWGPVHITTVFTIGLVIGLSTTPTVYTANGGVGGFLSVNFEV
jgi:hypothetical protein